MQKSLDSLEDRARDIAAPLGYPADRRRLGPRACGQLRLPPATSPTPTSSPTRWDALDDAPGAGDALLVSLEPRTARAAGAELDADARRSAARRCRDDDDRSSTTRAGCSSSTPFRRARRDAARRPRSRRRGRRSLPPPALRSRSSAGDAELVPRAYADRTRRVGRPAGDGDFDVRFASRPAAYRGRAVFFQIDRAVDAAPNAASRRRGDARPFWRVAATSWASSCSSRPLLLARSNLRAGRGDRRGAARDRRLHDRRLDRRLDRRRGTTARLEIERRPVLRVPGARAAQRRHRSGPLHRARALRPAVLARHPDLVDARPRAASSSIRASAATCSSAWPSASAMALLGSRRYSIVPALLGEPPWTPRATEPAVPARRADRRRRRCCA